MSIIIKNKEQIEGIRDSCRRDAEVLRKVAERVAPGVTTNELDTYAKELIEELGDRSAFFNYKPEGARTPFPGTICISVNEEVVHGLPSDYALQKGDIVSLDCGLIHKDTYFSDHAITVPVGEISDEAKKLLNITRESLMVGIQAAQSGNTTGDIGHAIESFIDGRYGIVRTLAGHGVGLSVHEDPFIPNFGRPGKGDVLKPGMIIAIEPMLNIGGDDVDLASDDWTFLTEDGGLSAHFEHTVLITEHGPEILTR